MSDPIKVMIDILVPNTSYPVFGGALPEHYDPSVDASGPCYVVTVKGGTPHSEIPYRVYHLMLDCWAGINKFQVCRVAYEQARLALHGLVNTDFGGDGRVITMLETGVGQDQYDQATGWCRNVSTYEMWLTDGPGSPNDYVSPTQTVKQYVDAAIAAEDANDNLWGSF